MTRNIEKNMKTKKSSQIKKARTATSHKRVVRRPIHKRVLLHPFSAFVLLCVGVLVAGSTFPGIAATFDVTATVEAPALTEPAVITSPSDQMRVGASQTAVVGTCPADSYVKLFRNSEFSGSAICNNGNHFTIQTALSLGANELKARVFNLTDNEGPASPAVTIYYDLPVDVESPASPPTTLKVSNLEVESYRPGAIQEVGSNPTVSGFAPPFSDVTITFYSEPSVCKTKANSLGVWSCTLSAALPPGLHHVVVTATTVSGQKLTLPTFEIKVTEYVKPFVVTSDYNYQAYRHGQSMEWRLGLSGGTAPYELHIDWGDGSTSRIVRQDDSEFVISHIYDSPDLSDKDYVVLVTAVDARGASTILQLSASVTGAALAVSEKNNIFASLFASVQRWLWVVWPAYIAVVLMVLSFWIGEREAYQNFMARRRAARPKPHARGR